MNVKKLEKLDELFVALFEIIAERFAERDLQCIEDKVLGLPRESVLKETYKMGFIKAITLYLKAKLPL